MLIDLTKRQGIIVPIDAPGDATSSSSLFYWREWAIFAGLILLVVITVGLLRRNGRKRIAEQRKLLFVQKFLFAKMYRNGPPYADPPVPLQTSYSQFRADFARGQSGNLAAPPPSYDPYATNLPAYQAKLDATVGASEVDATPHPAERTTTTIEQDAPMDEYRYTIPEANPVANLRH